MKNLREMGVSQEMLDASKALRKEMGNEKYGYYEDNAPFHSLDMGGHVPIGYSWVHAAPNLPISPSKKEVEGLMRECAGRLGLNYDELYR